MPGVSVCPTEPERGKLLVAISPCRLGLLLSGHVILGPWVPGQEGLASAALCRAGHSSQTPAPPCPPMTDRAFGMWPSPVLLKRPFLTLGTVLGLVPISPSRGSHWWEGRNPQLP